MSSLAGRVSGPVYTPADAGYAEEIAGFNTAVVHSPELVVAAATAADVAQAMRFAGENGLRVSVQGTGHGGPMAITHGLLISTRRLDQVTIDPVSRTATVGGGARWSAVVAAAAKHGLAPVGASATTVGVVGYLLGGGLGPLSRSHGFSSDHLLGLTVVTGGGEVVEASAEHHPDLFWALRGGKHGLGVVTEVRLRLIELATLYGGALFFDEPHIETALRAWLAWTASDDPRVTTSVAIVRFPPLDVVPPPLRGRRILSLRFAFPGAIAEGARLAAPLRAAAPVHLDALGELPAAEIARIHNDPTVPGPAFTAWMALTHIDQSFASALLERFGAGTEAPFIAVEVRQLGGAIRHDVAGGSAVGGRGMAFSFGLIAAQKPELFETELPAAVDRVITDIQPWLAAETNINMVGKPRSPEHYASAWSPATFARLAEIRRRYDPRGVIV